MRVMSNNCFVCIACFVLYCIVICCWCETAVLTTITINSQSICYISCTYVCRPMYVNCDSYNCFTFILINMIMTMIMIKRYATINVNQRWILLRDWFIKHCYVTTYSVVTVSLFSRSVGVCRCFHEKVGGQSRFRCLYTCTKCHCAPCGLHDV